jgi:hypothetical protein
MGETVRKIVGITGGAILLAGIVSFLFLLPFSATNYTGKCSGVSARAARRSNIRNGALP